MMLHWQAPVARRAAATPAGCHPRVLTGTKTLDAGLTAAAAAWWMAVLAGVARRRYEEERGVSTPPVEKLRFKGCGGDGRRASHSGGDDGARGGCGDGWYHAGAGAGRRRVRVLGRPPLGSGLRAKPPSFELSRAGFELGRSHT